MTATLDAPLVAPGRPAPTSGSHVGLTGADRLTVAAATAVLLACTSFFPVFAGQGWLLPAVGVVLSVTAAAMLSRRTRLSYALQPLVGLAVVVAYAVLLYARSTLHHVLLPGRDTLTAAGTLLMRAGSDLDSYAPPAPTTRALVLLVVLGVGAVMVLVDALAVLAGRAALTGLPLLLLFVVPSAVMSGGLGWFPFVVTAAGWLGLLLVEGRGRVGRWGAPLAGARRSDDPSDITRVGRRIGGAAVALAVVVPALLPGLDTRLFDGGSGDGSGSPGGGSDRSRTVVTYNPITRLQGQLTLPRPVTVLRYTTDDPSPDYLRMTTLGVYDGDGWRQEPLSGNVRQNGVDKQISLPQGRAATTEARVVTARITPQSLNVSWLPAPSTPSKVDVRGPWMWDPKSESVFATRTGTGRLGPYTVRSSRVLPNPRVMAEAETTEAVPEPVKPYDGVLARVTPAVAALTLNVTRGQKTAYGKALAIQSWFHDPANNFRYDLKTEPGSSPDKLESFLTQTRVGYCEQYAAAAAAMLRVAGIPSRVATGFTPGQRQPDGSYVVTTSQAHAWPEAWFAGAGWVRFEPTPSGEGIVTPNYGPATAVAGQEQAPTVPGGTSTDALGADETPQQRADRLEEERLARTGGDPAAPTDRAGGGVPVRRFGIGAGLLLLLAAPALLHAGRRRRRWRVADPAAAWDQVRDDATDVGHRWQDADTPRTAAGRLVADRHLEGPAAAAVERLSRAVERTRYARPDPEPVTGGAGDVVVVRRALLQGSGLPARLRARFLPPSTMRWAGTAAGTAVADLLDAVDGVVAGSVLWLRRRLRRA